ncbi:MAG: DUF6240 domain-containing protein [Defluviitaleaceae bacterium]|nr:DUF6240 domain-containing protein [Defluviitaleaceae bacterium]
MQIQGFKNNIAPNNNIHSILEEEPLINLEQFKQPNIQQETRIGGLSAATIFELFERANFTTNEPDYYDEEHKEALEKELELLKNRLKNSATSVTEAINLMLSNGVPISSLNVAALNAELNKIAPPITPELEIAAEKDISLFEEIKDLTESEKINAIKNEENLTFESVYKAKHAAENIEKVNVFPELEAELAKLVPEEKIQAAKLLYENGIDLTSENLKSYEQLTNLKDVSSENVREFSYYKNYAGEKSIELPKLIQYDFFKKKLAMVEAQVKLTTEAALNLINLDINAKPAEELLLELKNLEKAYLNEVSGSNEFFESIAIAKDPLPPVFKSVVSLKAPFNIETIVNEQIKAKAALGYEALATVPNSKFGDSFAKVADKLGGVLEGHNIPVNEENIRIASIMSRAGIDINPNAFEEVYIAHKKIDYVQNKLHPTIALELLKSGDNLLKMPIEDLIEKIEAKTFSDGLFLENIAEHILKLEGKISAEERQQLMAIYKTLHRINSFGGASLGVNIKNINSLTLGSLLDSYDTFADHSSSSIKNLISEAEASNLERAAKIVEDIKNLDTHSIQLLEKNRIPVLGNVEVMASLVSKPKLLTEILKEDELEEIIEALPTSPESYLEAGTENKIEAALYEKIDLNTKIMNFTKTMRLQNRLNTGSYSFPINFKGNVTNLHMYVPGDFTGSPNVVISINGVEVFINTTTMDVYLKGTVENETLLRELFESRDFQINNVIFGDKVSLGKQSHKIMPELTKQNMFQMASCITRYLEQV